MEVPKRGDLVMIEWIDIQSCSSWTNEKIEPTRCYSVGFLDEYGGMIGDGYYRIYASFNEHEVGDVIVIPIGVVKDITIIKKNAKEKIRNMVSRVKRLHTG